MRSAALRDVLDLASQAIAARVSPSSRPAAAMAKLAERLAEPRAGRVSTLRREPAPPVVSHFARALAIARGGPPDLAPLVAAIERLGPDLAWRRRDGGDAAFAEGHANTDFVGSNPAALEPRPDAWIGMSLVAPGVTYPYHRHPPEEVYLVLSGGEWRQEAGPWSTPGIGGIVYNPHDIVHAMRAGSEPLLALWCLPVDAR